jgi:hypothetical protein
VFVVSRVDPERRVEYLVGFNAGVTAATVTVQTSTPSSTFGAPRGMAQAGMPPRSGADGRVTLTLPPLSTFLRMATSGIPAAAAPRAAVRVGADEFTDFWRVSATVPGIAPVSVAFAVRRAGAARWQRLAADDSPPYRAFLDPLRYRRNERVHVVGVVRALDGSTAVSPVVPFTVRRR